MTIADATVCVSCDEVGCISETFVEMAFVSDRGVAHYDHAERSIEVRLVDGTGWTVNENGEDGHRHFCEACSDDRADRAASDG